MSMTYNKTHQIQADFDDAEEKMSRFSSFAGFGYGGSSSSIAMARAEMENDRDETPKIDESLLNQQPPNQYAMYGGGVPNNNNYIMNGHQSAPSQFVPLSRSQENIHFKTLDRKMSTQGGLHAQSSQSSTPPQQQHQYSQQIYNYQAMNVVPGPIANQQQMTPSNSASSGVVGGIISFFTGGRNHGQQQHHNQQQQNGVPQGYANGVNVGDKMDLSSLQQQLNYQQQQQHDALNTRRPSRFQQAIPVASEDSVISRSTSHRSLPDAPPIVLPGAFKHAQSRHGSIRSEVTISKDMVDGEGMIYGGGGSSLYLSREFASDKETSESEGEYVPVKSNRKNSKANGDGVNVEYSTKQYHQQLPFKSNSDYETNSEIYGTSSSSLPAVPVSSKPKAENNVSKAVAVANAMSNKKSNISTTAVFSASGLTVAQQQQDYLENSSIDGKQESPAQSNHHKQQAHSKHDVWKNGGSSSSLHAKSNPYDFEDPTTVETVLETLGKEHDWLPEEISADLALFSKNRLRTVKDLRRINRVTFDRIQDLLPVVKDLVWSATH